MGIHVPAGDMVFELGLKIKFNRNGISIGEIDAPTFSHPRFTFSGDPHHYRASNCNQLLTIMLDIDRILIRILHQACCCYRGFVSATLYLLHISGEFHRDCIHMIQ